MENVGQKSVTISKYKIGNLNPNIKDAFVICLIIEKSDVRQFNSKFDNRRKGVITLTVRDSDRHFANCTVWGTDMFIESYDSFYKCGDVVAIISPTVVHRISNASNQLKPVTSSPYELTIRENVGKIIHFDGDSREYMTLLRTPIKPTATVLSLNDVNLNGTRTTGDLVDVLVIVRSLKPIRNWKNKNGEEQMVRNVIVMDKSCSGMIITIWKKNLIERSSRWQPMKTVLHMINVRIDFSNFHKSVTLGIHSQTIITENPNTKHTKDLQIFANNLPPGNIDAMTTSNVDLASITKVMTVQQVIDRINGKFATEANENEFTAVIYGVISKMNLDDCQQIIIRRCSVCHKSIPFTAVECENEDCFLIEENWQQKYRDSLEVKMEIIDHTGTLPNCQLIGDAVESTLGHSIDGIRYLTDEQLGNIKMKWFFERCCFKLFIRKKSPIRDSTFVNILDCRLADPVEVANNIKIY